ncbi:MAG: hypothetical protein FD145_1236 [Candidatus Saganbacteria bacterium]|uniref:Uncharacterized protein n=1 Tax=Candidatus Saganbacteria bacterium TaxID=2575572 RepID=A0A833L304_UNCSA|nr:MAG: hypothetical protein FD145_1236 [Candidatus Saganbacteria bacterium]
MSMPTTNSVSKPVATRPVPASIPSSSPAIQSSITVEQVESQLNANVDYSSFDKLPQKVQGLINQLLSDTSIPIFEGWYKILLAEKDRIFASPANGTKKSQIIRLIQFLTLLAFGVKHGLASKEFINSLFAGLFDAKKKNESSDKLEAVYNKLVRFFKYQAQIASNFKNCAFDMNVVDDSSGTIDKSQKFYPAEEKHFFAYLKKIKIVPFSSLFTSHSSSIIILPPQINFLRNWIAFNLPENKVIEILPGMLRNNNLDKLLKNEDGSFNVIKTMIDDQADKNKIDAVRKIIASPIYDPVVARIGELLAKIKDSNSKGKVYFFQFGADNKGLWDADFQKAYARFLKDHAPGLKPYIIMKQHLEKLYEIARAQAQKEVNSAKTFLQRFSNTWQQKYVGNFTRFRGTYDFVDCLKKLRICGQEITNVLGNQPVDSINIEKLIQVLSLLRKFEALKRPFLEYNFALLVPKKVLLIVLDYNGTPVGTVKKTTAIENNWNKIKHLFNEKEQDVTKPYIRFLTFNPEIVESAINSLTISKGLKSILQQALKLRTLGKFEEIKQAIERAPINIQVINTPNNIEQFMGSVPDSYQSRLYENKNANLLVQVVVQPDGKMTILLKKKWKGERLQRIAAWKSPAIGKNWRLQNIFNETFMQALKVPVGRLHVVSPNQNEKVGIILDNKLACNDCTTISLPAFYQQLAFLQDNFLGPVITTSIFRGSQLDAVVTLSPRKAPPNFRPYLYTLGGVVLAGIGATTVFASLAVMNLSDLLRTQDYGERVDRYWKYDLNRNIAIGCGIGTGGILAGLIVLGLLSTRKVIQPQPQIVYSVTIFRK